ncbi:MAG: response regulator [Burkholderiales bacterium]|nr:response regulator [Burkholderiales bacterium]
MKPRQSLGERPLLLIICFFLCYLLLATVSIWVAKLSGLISVVWLANGAAFAFFLKYERRLWPAFAISMILAHASAAWLHAFNPLLGAAAGSANVIEVLVAATIATRFYRHQEHELTFGRATQLLCILIFIGIPLGGLLGGTIAQHAMGLSWGAAYENWLLGRSVGAILTVVPAVLLSQGAPTRQLWINRMPQTLLGLGASLAITYVLLTFLHFRFIYVAVPLLIIAVRLGTLTASLICAVLVVFFGELMFLGFIPTPETLLIAGPRGVWPGVALTALLPQLAGLIWDDNQRQSQALAASELQFRSAMEIAATGFVLTDTEGRFREVNSSFCRTVGYTREELLSMQHLDIVHEADRERVSQTRKMLVLGELDRYALEKRYVRRDGSIVWALGKGACLRRRDGEIEIMLEVEDITKRRAHEQEIATLSERLRLATEAFHMGTWDLNLRDASLDWDAQMYALYGINQPTSASRYEMWRSRVHPDDLAATEEALQQSIQTGAAFQHEFRIVHPDGQVRYISAGGLIKTDLDGTPSHMIGMNWDITARKQTELALATARDAAEAAAKTKGEFLANMSHEIRTPMNAVLGMAHLLGNTGLNQEQQQYLSMIEQSGKSLLSILNDVLDISKIDAGRLELMPGEFNLDEVMSVLVSVMSINAGEKELELAIGVDPDVPRILVGDSLRLQQILINLTGNAIKFTEQGEVSLLTSLQAREDHLIRLKFSVRDTGIGMNDAQLERLFQAFSQGDASTTRRYGGTGLGLNICKRFVDLMGGSIGVDSEQGVGSRFWVDIPFNLPEQPSTLRIYRPDKELKLLVIEDNQTAREYFAKIIAAWGWQADLVSSGEEALLLLQSQPDHAARYDAALIDWKMPKMDGLATMHAIRAVLRKPTFPVLMMVSAYARESLLNEDAASEINGIITKPVTSSALFDALQQAVLGQQPIAPQARSTFANRFAGYCILLVEDTRVNQLVAAGMLKQLGARFEIAANGEIAVERIKAEPGQFDLVLMDIQMPVMDGIAATRHMRQQLGLSIPIVAMSAGVMQAERDLCAAAGMNDFVAKPIEVDRLVSVMARFLPEKAATREELAQSRAQVAVSPMEQLFHPDDLLHEVMGDQTVQRQIIAEFVKDTRGFVDAARLALATQALQDAKRMFHTLKGTAGTLSAHQVMNLARAAETAMLDGDTQKAQHVLEQLAPALDALFIEIATWLEREGEAGRADAPEPGAEPPIDHDAQLAVLIQLMRDHNMRACKEWEALKPLLANQLGAETITSLSRALVELRFGDAVTELEAKLAELGTSLLNP